MSNNANPPPSFDPIWEESIYGKGKHLNRWPFDVVVSFVFRNYPREKPRDQTTILEIGCGAGNNLWFCALEGFRVIGIDGSASAIEFARKRLCDDGLSGELYVGDFAQLPVANERCELAIDRGSLTCCGLTTARQAVREVWRTLRPGGKFFCNPYSSQHTSAISGDAAADGLTVNIRRGTLTGVGQLCFYDRAGIDSLFGPEWQILTLEHVSIESRIGEDSVHAEWRIVAQKP